MYKICSIKIDKSRNKTLLDCNGKTIHSTNAMNRRYRKNRLLHTTEIDTPVVWVLIGKDKNNNEKYLQVGQCKNLYCMLSNDIRRNVNEILSNNSALNGYKYANLANKYCTLTFWEINFEDYDLTEISFINNIPQDEYLKKIYLSIKASFIEGKIAFEENCSTEHNDEGIWNASPIGLDGYFYSYFKNI